MLQQVDTLLFEMAILCSLTGESGKTWKRHPSQFLAIECTEVYILCYSVKIITIGFHQLIKLHHMILMQANLMS